RRLDGVAVQDRSHLTVQLPDVALVRARVIDQCEDEHLALPDAKALEVLLDADPLHEARVGAVDRLDGVLEPGQGECVHGGPAYTLATESLPRNRAEQRFYKSPNAVSPSAAFSCLLSRPSPPAARFSQQLLDARGETGGDAGRTRNGPGCGFWPKRSLSRPRALAGLARPGRLRRAAAGAGTARRALAGRAPWLSPRGRGLEPDRHGESRSCARSSGSRAGRSHRVRLHAAREAARRKHGQVSLPDLRRRAPQDQVWKKGSRGVCGGH